MKKTSVIIKSCERCGRSANELVKMGWSGNSGFKKGICAKCQYENKGKWRMKLSDVITKEEYEQLPTRCKMIWQAGFLYANDIKELMKGR